MDSNIFSIIKAGNVDNLNANLDRLFGVEKSSTSKYGQGKHVEKVSVTRGGKTFERKQTVGFTGDERFAGKLKEEPKTSKKTISEFASSADTKTLKEFVTVGADLDMKKIAIEELKKRGVKVREPALRSDTS